MKKHTHLSHAERCEIAILREKGYSMRKIAKALGRSVNTISYEIKRNSVCGSYHAKKAHSKACVRKRMSTFQWSKINEDEVLRNYIIEKLEKGWNPDAIAGRMKKDSEDFYASKSAIYEWLRSARGQKYCKHLYSQRYRVKKRRKKTKREMIPCRVGIKQRGRGADNRSRYGHYEVDTVVSGRHGSGALSVMIERRSRYVIIRKLTTMKPSEHATVLQNNIDQLKVRSLTFDNGIENKDHQSLGVSSYFCDPYSSWQKGSVENVNKMIRQYIPKGSDISQYTESYIQWIQDRINEQPRKILEYRSAREVAILGGLFSKGGVS